MALTEGEQAIVKQLKDIKKLLKTPMIEVKPDGSKIDNSGIADD